MKTDRMEYKMNFTVYAILTKSILCNINQNQVD